eukprot:Hpha_TRINITY_DN15232_c0_g3::TRINITY_DN15232_c0_g3_i1::g.66502::m.66502/K00604/MTFMT, fmt; methionyl-tRNA formyltransferase
MLRSCRVWRRHNLLFFGSEGISTRCLEPLVADFRGKRTFCKHLEVVTPPLCGKRRPSRLADFARELNIPLHQPSDPVSLKTWRPPEPPDGEKWDVGVVVSFRYFLPSRVLGVFRKGCINVHPSALPKYRGSSPLQRTIMNADRRGGVCVIKIMPGERMDHGDVLLREELDVSLDERLSDYYQRASSVGARLLSDCLDDFERRWVGAERQEGRARKEEDPHFAHRIHRAVDGTVTFARETAGVVYHRWRGMELDGGLHAVFKRSCVPTASRRPRSSQDARTALLDLVHPRDFPPGHREELAALDAPGPGSVYFPHSLHRVAKSRGKAVTERGQFYIRCSAEGADVDPCLDGPPLPWIGCKEVHLACEKPKTSVDLLTGYQFKCGHVYEGVFL